MKKTIILGLLTVGLTANAHKFITEILVETNPTQYNPNYNYVQSFNLSDNDILNMYDEKPSYLRRESQYFKDRIELETLKEVLTPEKTEETIVCPPGEHRSKNTPAQKTCGQFDHFNAARTAAVKTCYQLNQLNQGMFPSGLIPLYYGPTTFVDAGKAADDHHINYNISQGLHFACVEVTVSNQ